MRSLRNGFKMDAVLFTRRALLAAPFVAIDRAARRAAVHRGIRFLIDVARTRVHFDEYAPDLLFCFHSLSEATSDPELRRLCLDAGRERAAYWRGTHPAVPEKAGPVRISNLVYACLSVNALGFPDPAMKADLAHRAAQLSAVDFLGFDPSIEGPPADIPQRCRKCRKENVRGVRRCEQCGRKLDMTSRYDVFFEALLAAYFGERYGIRLGAPLADVTRWIASLRPYQWRGRKPDDDFYSIAYTITHILYVHNDYDLRALPRTEFQQEFDFLRTHFRRNMQMKDPETLGEFIDSLLVLGMPES
ncbi:MAG: hypothetical protein JNK48_23650, partial [Bryobacterales bacterium]|nr:hypothetical protein [Bryobacterales bacterium]